VDPNKDLKVSVIEAAPRILPALPLRLSLATTALLERMGVEVITNKKVAEVVPSEVRFADGSHLPAELIVWAAGVKAPDFLKEIAGLETNRINQLVVLPTLQTSRDPNIFAMGDCVLRAHGLRPMMGRAVLCHPVLKLLINRPRISLNKFSYAWPIKR
jgi:NADH dehydrogenase